VQDVPQDRKKKIGPGFAMMNTDASVMKETITNGRIHQEQTGCRQVIFALTTVLVNS